MNELELSKRIKNHDPEAYKELYNQYAPFLYATIVRYVVNPEKAKDLLHDTFLRIFEKSALFTYQSSGSLKAWITRIAINECMKLFRAEKKLKFLPLDERDDKDTSDENAIVDESDVDNIPEEVIQEMINRLPEGYRLVFNLYVIDGKNHKEIADILEINEKSSSSQLARAKKKLAQEICNWRKTNG